MTARDQGHGSPGGGHPEIRVLLFDVGGVLVQLGGVDVMRSWLGHGISAEELWRMWLESEAVRRFETGKADALEFSTELTREFGLSISPADFLAAFDTWPLGLYPGTTDMLARIPSTYRRALLSNTNALHWPRMHGDMALGALFDTHFVSHLTGSSNRTRTPSNTCSRRWIAGRRSFSFWTTTASTSRRRRGSACVPSACKVPRKRIARCLHSESPTTG